MSAVTMTSQDSHLGYPRAIIFDLMGTCLDWHASIIPILEEATLGAAEGREQPPPSEKDVSDLALEWRQGFFDEIHARFEAAEAPEDIDVTHNRVFRRLLNEPKWETLATMSEEAIGSCVAAWHKQKGMPANTLYNTL